MGTVVNGGSTSYQSTINYTYDGGDRLTQAADSVSGNITRAYDLLDRLTSETTPQGSIGYTYDAANRRATMTVAGQPQVTYTFDDANRLTQISQGANTVGFSYDNANRRTTLTLPNGIVTSYSYDNGSELTGLSYKKGTTTLGNLSYGYDIVGRRTQMSGSFARTGLPNALTSASYDAANELTQWGANALTYDSDGNLVNDGASTYSWDARNQLSSMSGSVNASFGYDAFGRRIGRNSTSFLYDGVNSIQELAGGSPTANILTGGIDENFLRSDISGTWNLLSDALGSTTVLTDSSGTIQTQYTYEPFGNTSLTGAADSNTEQYTGRENDGTGLYYYRARYYSPVLQRFVSEDPSQFSGGINFYAYALDNPLSFVDPVGLDVTVIAYPGTSGNPGGHAAVSVNGSPAVGFNPAAGWDLVTVLGLFTPELGVVPGVVLPIAPGRQVDPGCSTGPCIVKIHTTPEQDQAMLNYIKYRAEHPGIYQVYGRNCSTFVYDVLRAGGVDAPYTPLPRQLVNGLSQN